METINKEIQIRIGHVTYYFDCKFYYYEGNNAIDPTRQEEWEYRDYELLTDIEAVHDDGRAWIVGYPAEIEQVIKQFDPESELENALS